MPDIILPSPGLFQSYTPTFTGFSADPTGGFYYYTKIGKMVTVFIRQPNTGTSNATTFTISLPLPARNLAGMFWANPCMIVNNGVTATSPGIMLIDTTVSLTAIQVFTNTALATWTASGGKRVPIGTLIYETA